MAEMDKSTAHQDASTTNAGVSAARTVAQWQFSGWRGASMPRWLSAQRSTSSSTGASGVQYRGLASVRLVLGL